MKIEHIALWTRDLSRLKVFLKNPDHTTYAAWAHLAIAVGSEARVDALPALLAADGCLVLDGPRRTGDGC